MTFLIINSITNNTTSNNHTIHVNNNCNSNSNNNDVNSNCEY